MAGRGASTPAAWKGPAGEEDSCGFGALDSVLTLQVFRNGIIENVAGDVRERDATGTLRLHAAQVESQVIVKVLSSMTALSHA